MVGYCVTYEMVGWCVIYEMVGYYYFPPLWVLQHFDAGISGQMDMEKIAQSEHVQISTGFMPHDAH